LAHYKIAEGKVAESEQGAAQILLFSNPDEQEKKFLVENFKLDEHTLNSALDPEEPSRIEFEPDHIAVIFKRPKNYSGKDQFLFKVASMGLFLFKEKLVIIMSEDIPVFTGKHFAHLSSLNDVFLKVIYYSIYHFLEHLRIVNMISEEIEKKISRSMENKYLLNLFSLEKSLVYYISAINSNGFVFEKLRNNSPKLGFSQASSETLDDIIIENSQCLRQAEIYSNILASLMDARVSIVSNNLNILMKTLNIITIGIMIPTLVVSIFSMNVEFPFRNHPHAFWGILGIAFASVISVMFYWKKFKKW
ncbi:MAG: magnesium transporter CorA family protein, partial [Elusimicrobia bacterium]|nr:magnesium transporter CorA family protein [Elusimicrobiota bacterium]